MSDYVTKPPIPPAGVWQGGASTRRLALIGCGAIAEQYYLPALARHPAVLGRLILVDQDRQRAATLAGKFGVERVSQDYRDVMQEVDAAILAVPTQLHHPIGLELLANHVHVLSEKPLAESADKAREMVEAAERTGMVLAANYQRRLFPPLMKVKELLDGGSLGRPLAIRYRVGEEYDWESVTAFRFAPGTMAGGVLRDRGAHVMYVLSWWLGGKPQVISSENDSFGGPEAVARVHFVHEGCRGEVLVSWLTKFPNTFEVKCEGGTLRGDIYDNHSILLIEAGGPGDAALRQRRLPLTEDGGYHAIADRMITSFLEAIGGGAPPLVSGRDALPSIEFIDECYNVAKRFDMPWYQIRGRDNGR